MAGLVTDFLAITGAGPVPATMSELIPWLITVIVGICMLCAMFRTMGVIASLFTARWKL